MGKSRPPARGMEAGATSFARLAEIVRDAGIALPRPEAAPVAPPPQPAPPPPPEPPSSDETLFDEARRGVMPRRWSGRSDAAAAAGDPEAGEPRPPLPAPDDSEDRRLFEAAVDGEPGPVPLDHPEYI